MTFTPLLLAAAGLAAAGTALIALAHHLGKTTPKGDQ